MAGPLCPYCGAISPDRCEVTEDYGLCPWEEDEHDTDEDHLDDGADYED
jgi:hypothetical protein